MDNNVVRNDEIYLKCDTYFFCFYANEKKGSFRFVLVRFVVGHKNLLS